MNTHAQTARKNMDVLTLVLIMVVVTAALAVATYFMMHDVLPAIQNFQHQLTSSTNTQR